METHNTREVEEMVTHLLMATNAYGYFSKKGITSLRQELSEYLHHQLQKATEELSQERTGFLDHIAKLEKTHQEELQKARAELKARIELLLENNTYRDNMDFSHGYRNALLDIESYLSKLDQDKKQ